MRRASGADTSGSHKIQLKLNPGAHTVELRRGGRPLKLGFKVEDRVPKRGVKPKGMVFVRAFPPVFGGISSRFGKKERKKRNERKEERKKERNEERKEERKKERKKERNEERKDERKKERNEERQKERKKERKT